jgi:hypothetical protein
MWRDLDKPEWVRTISKTSMDDAAVDRLENILLAYLLR